MCFGSNQDIIWNRIGTLQVKWNEKTEARFLYSSGRTGTNQICLRVMNNILWCIKIFATGSGSFFSASFNSREKGLTSLYSVACISAWQLESFRPRYSYDNRISLLRYLLLDTARLFYFFAYRPTSIMGSSNWFCEWAALHYNNVNHVF